MSKSVIGIIGGSGLYQMEGVEAIEEIELETPFGKPSDVIIRGRLSDAEVLFLPRHGRGHRLTPSEINYRANIYAFKQLGAQWCISVSAVGSLVEDIAPGHIVLPDQLIDRTRTRSSSFFGSGIVAHIAFGEPYCPVLSDILAAASHELAAELGITLHRGGTLVCMEGPAFSTRAESHLYRSWGAQLIGMTALPEAKLAREAELAYATLALVTDYDCWKEDEADVEVSHIIETMLRNTENAKRILADAVVLLTGARPSEQAAAALKNAVLTDLASADPVKLEELRLFLKKYLPQP